MFERLKQNLAFLVNRTDGDFQSFADSLIKELPLSMATSMKELILLRVLYCTKRYEDWIDCESFYEVLQHGLIIEDGLSARNAEALLASLRVKLSKNVTSKNDINFLQLLFTIILTTRGVIADNGHDCLGFGFDVLRKIRLIVHQEVKRDQVVFASSFETKIESAYRNLRDQIGDHFQNWLPVHLRLLLLRSNLNCLCQIDSSAWTKLTAELAGLICKPISRGEVEHALSSFLPDGSEHAILEELKKKEVVNILPKTMRKSEVSISENYSNAFADFLLSQLPSDVDPFSLPEPIQNVYFRSISDQQLRDILSQSDVEKLHLTTFEVIVSRLKGGGRSSLKALAAHVFESNRPLLQHKFKAWRTDLLSETTPN